MVDLNDLLMPMKTKYLHGMKEEDQFRISSNKEE